MEEEFDDDNYGLPFSLKELEFEKKPFFFKIATRIATNK